MFKEFKKKLENFNKVFGLFKLDISNST